MSDLFGEAASLHPATCGYALVYGSHASGTAGPRSDLDLLYVGGPELAPRRTADLVQAVKELHARHGLDLDEEVPYPVKLYATDLQAQQAAGLGGFPGRPRPLPTQRTTTALSTQLFRLRLAFNVLTSPHIFLGGDVTAYRRHVARAERSAALLALAFRAPQPSTLEEAALALWRSPTGAMGKDFLGYLQAAHLRSVLGRGFADLHAAHLARCEGGRWRRMVTAIPGGD